LFLCTFGVFGGFGRITLIFFIVASPALEGLAVILMTEGYAISADFLVATSRDGTVFCHYSTLKIGDMLTLWASWEACYRARQKRLGPMVVQPGGTVVSIRGD
jgi:hypothetical protein